MQPDWAIWVERMTSGGWQVELSSDDSLAYIPESYDGFVWSMVSGLCYFHYHEWEHACVPRDRSGLPDDLSRELSGLRGRNYYSFSWVWLEEILTLDLDQFAVHKGFVSDELAAGFNDPPTKFPEELFRNGVPSPKREKAQTYAHGYFGTEVRWIVTLGELLRPRLDEYLEPILKLGDPDKIRLIVGCD